MTIILEEYQQRVIAEKIALDTNLFKLRRFRLSEIFDKLPFEEQGLLIQQELHMTSYSEVLGKRIARYSF